MHPHQPTDRPDLIALAWLWCQRGKPAAPSAVTKALKALAPDAAAVQASLDRLVQSGDVERIAPATKKGKPAFRITAQGERRAAASLRASELPAGKSPWAAVSGVLLPAVALDLPAPEPTKPAQSAFAKLLPVAVCVRRLGLDVPLDRGPAEAKLALVKLAIARSQGGSPDNVKLKKLPAGELPALVARPLLNQPDAAAANLDKLIDAAAVGLLGGGFKAAQVKFAVVRRWVGGDDRAASMAAPPAAPVQAPPVATPAAAADDVEHAAFVARVLAAAQDVARAGGPGVSNLGDKVLVHFAWRRYQERFGAVPLDTFKRRVSDANGDGLILSREDLVPPDRAAEFREAEVRTGASVYHYLRI